MDVDAGFAGRGQQRAPQVLCKRPREIDVIDRRIALVDTVCPTRRVVDQLCGDRDLTWMQLAVNHADSIDRDHRIDTQ